VFCKLIELHNSFLSDNHIFYDEAKENEGKFYEFTKHDCHITDNVISICDSSSEDDSDDLFHRKKVKRKYSNKSCIPLNKKNQDF